MTVMLLTAAVDASVQPAAAHASTSASGATTVGSVDPATMTWYLRNANGAGPPDVAPFAFGAPA